ncbi:MAG: tetratricopeptide repeat protein [Ignavibacteriales bacterium]|nr:MAG: tetratricopeptide repeat protein [Ignavibacteriales bacterium]
MKFIIPFFILSALLISGCSGESAEDLMKAARQNIDQQKYIEAAPLLEKLVAEFPENELAPTALYDLANLYQKRNLTDLTEKQALVKASELFKKVYDDYPSSKEAAYSLFMAGFIKANEPISEYKDATELYNLFIEKFPNHEMVSSAKAELKFMGIPADQIITDTTLTRK